MVRIDWRASTIRRGLLASRCLLLSDHLLVWRLRRVLWSDLERWQHISAVVSRLPRIYMSRVPRRRRILIGRPTVGILLLRIIALCCRVLLWNVGSLLSICCRSCHSLLKAVLWRVW